MKTEALIKRYSLLKDSLLESSEHFRNGRDNSGLDSFLGGIDELEDIIRTLICLEDFDSFNEISQLLNMIYEAVRNTDVTGLTDILEYKALPLAEKWLEGT